MAPKNPWMTAVGLGIGLLVSTLTWSSAVEAAAAPDVSFGFEGTFSGTGGELTISPSCPINLPGPCVSSSAFGSQSGDGYWQWTSESERGGGFIVDTSTKLTGTYTILLKFSLSDLEDEEYRKVIDYLIENGSSQIDDNGVYLYDGYLDYYSFDDSEEYSDVTKYSSGELITMVMTRSNDGTLTFYSVSGGVATVEFTFDDSDGYAIARDQGSGSRLAFFTDDEETTGEVSPEGRVYDLRMWAGRALTQSEIETVADGGSAITVDIGGLSRLGSETNQNGLPRTGQGTSSSLVILASLSALLGLAVLEFRARRPSLRPRR